MTDCKGSLSSSRGPEHDQLGHHAAGRVIVGSSGQSRTAMVPRHMAISTRKTKDGQILPVPNVAVRDAACAPNHRPALHPQNVSSPGLLGAIDGRDAHSRRTSWPQAWWNSLLPRSGEAQINNGRACSFAASEVGSVLLGATLTSCESTMFPKAGQGLCAGKSKPGRGKGSTVATEGT